VSGPEVITLGCRLNIAESDAMRALAGDRDAALRHLAWVLDHATPEGRLPEQVPDHLLHPEHRQEWLDRCGPVATPLP
jgi:hypothetical protein